ncbi:MAG: CoA-binding protein [Archaeoglobus sp.]|nr:CoA-binding protein [Archaeoglobus sp.]
MAIILDENTRVLIQGITGREGQARSRFMLEYGTKVVAGVTPGRGGTEVWHIPVYNTVKEAVKERGPIDLTVTFVPGPLVKDAVLEALNAGIKKVVMPVERVPLYDALEIIAYAKRKGATIIGPGSLGLISPGKAVAGWIGGTEELAKDVFKSGPVGVVSRSGGQTTTVCWAITREGLGVSTAIHIGSEPVVGTTFAEALPLFEKDNETQVVVLFGEIGGTAEEDSAEIIKMGKFTKPLVAYIAGTSAQAGIRYSHASAIIEGGKGDAQSKIKALSEIGAQVVSSPKNIAPTVKRILKR